MNPQQQQQQQPGMEMPTQRDQHAQQNNLFASGNSPFAAGSGVWACEWPRVGRGRCRSVGQNEGRKVDVNNQESEEARNVALCAQWTCCLSFSLQRKSENAIRWFFRRKDLENGVYDSSGS